MTTSTTQICEATMTRRHIGILVLTSAALLLTGCESNQPETEDEMAIRLHAEMQAMEDVSADSIFNDLTPELLGMSSRHIDARRDAAVTGNINWRMFWDDWGRALLLDRPSRLTPMAVPY